MAVVHASGAGWRLARRLGGLLVALVLLGATGGVARAQRPVHRVALGGGSGLSVGSAQGTAVSRRTPFFVEASYRQRSSEALQPWFGVGLRAEVESRASVAVVPAAQLERQVGPVSVRPLLALPFFFAPFSLLGAELGLDVAYELGGGLACVLGLRLDGFFWGSDLPEGSALVMANAMLGVEMTWEQ